MDIVERKYSPQIALTLLKAGHSALLSRLFASRGITCPTELQGGLTELLPYSDLKNAIEMAAVLAEAIETSKELVIVADYDADGATACATGVRALTAFGAKVRYVVPDRLTQGYGLTPGIVQDVASMRPRPDFIITVDNGIASHDGIALANELGIAVLVTDHHLPADTLPAALLIVDPSQPGCTFPSKSIAGCGVMYYVMWALQDTLSLMGLPQKDLNFNVTDLLPIVAIGTVADVVTLDFNNRILVSQGIIKIKEACFFPGIKELIKISGKSTTNLATSDIAFGIGPRINAAGRLQSMTAGIECLITNDEQVAVALAIELNSINNQRKEIEGDITDEATHRLLTDVQPSRYTAVLFAENWHHGVIGVVAGRIKERIWRPTFVLASGHEGELRGSGRSVPGFHLRDALDLVSKRSTGLLLKFGGHAMAAGVSIRAGGLDEFSALFEEVARELLPPSALNQILEVDGGLSSTELTLDTVSALKQQVWGQGFPEPLFMDTFDVIESREMGGGKHLKLTLRKDGKIYQAVKFRHLEGRPAPRILATYKIDSNTFNNRTDLQLLLENYTTA
ncbi:MAG: single-stranded-DNA-specific exonuclease RecJ [Agitococcus sp.]|nr:single-stranded-DNA-specific exonuclease RecJ [Agitococcus sp.]MDO9177007.1 single-stranded-DNA-specific exonuclease RecJ [Agitococcus sp.]